MTEEASMRVGSTVALCGIGLVLALAGIDCSAGGGGSKFTTGSGGGGGGTGSLHSSASGVGGGFATSGGTGGMAVPDDDPTNPNITHPTCNVGNCLDFPADPLLGDN